MRDPFLVFFLLMCLYPLLFFALPGYLIGRYRLRVRSPFTLAERASKEEQRQQIRRIVQREDKDRIGYGAPK